MQSPLRFQTRTPQRGEVLQYNKVEKGPKREARERKNRMHAKVK